MSTNARLGAVDSLAVVVLCGGRGTRMYDALPTQKVLVEVGGRPILWHVMKIYAAYGHTHFILTLGYQGEAVKRYFLEYEPMSCDFTLRLGHAHSVSYHQANDEEDWEITLADTGVDTEKGARIHRVAKHIREETFFVTYGEAVGDVDLDALLAFHRGHGRLATVTGVHPWSQYGILEIDDRGQVSGFIEKPLLDHWINAGFMVFDRKVLGYLGASENIDLEREVLPRLAAEGQLMMYCHTGYWRSMKTFKDAQELDTIWRENAPWRVW